MEETAQMSLDHMDEDTPNDLEFHNLTLLSSQYGSEPQNRVLWRLLAASGATHS